MDSYSLFAADELEEELKYSEESDNMDGEDILIHRFVSVHAHAELNISEQHPAQWLISPIMRFYPEHVPFLHESPPEC